MNSDKIIEYYSKPIVRKEIVDYSKNKWIALHTTRGGEEGGLFIRYWKKSGDPLYISKEEEIDGLIKRFLGLGPRTIYASVNVYSVVSRESIEDPKYIVYTTPIWDIDGTIEHWEKMIEAARVIVEFLEKEGVSKSVYLKWSGRGIHVQIHERAFSKDILSKYHPLDIAYSIVEYVLKKTTKRLVEIAKEAPSEERPLKVENEIDIKRVFTVPLSLHKFLDYSAVCFKPNEIDNFTLDWAKPDVLKHNPDWRVFVEGEADNLAINAIKEIGGYFKKVGEIRTVVQVAKSVAKPKTVEKPVIKTTAKLGRFQVMALLQAARYYLLTGDVEKAKSFGLNRAIFYAWAKHHGRERIFRRVTGREKDVEVLIEKGKKMVFVGDEGAFLSNRDWFIIGNKEQLPSDYDREIARKINSVIPYDLAWQKALEYLKKFPKSTLLNQQKFFEAYKKVRDDFIEKVVKGEKKESTLLDFTKFLEEKSDKNKK